MKTHTFLRFSALAACAATLIVCGVETRADEKQPAASEATATKSKLAAQEQAEVDHALDGWKQATKKIEKYECTFKHWVYDSTYLPPETSGKGAGAWRVGVGEFKYSAPDKWSCRETAVWERKTDPTTRQLKLVKLDHGEHWARNGKTVCQVHDEQQIVEKMPLPPDDEIGQGWLSGLFDYLVFGPPRIFGVRTDYFQEGYDVRIITPTDVKDEFWLESVPRRKRRKTQFEKVEVILRKKDMLPSAIRLTLSPNNSEVYEFENQACNNQVKAIIEDTFAPKPEGYRVVENPPLPEPRNGKENKK